MQIYTAQNLILSEMRKHDLIARGWSYELDGSRTRFGVCKHDRKVLGFSRHNIRLNNEADVLDTIRHEIAHALVGAGHGHDLVWKRKAREVGARPQRHTAKHVKVAYKWVATCRCGIEFGRNRLTQNVRHNSACPTCHDPLVWRSGVK